MESPAATTVTARKLLCRLCMSARQEMVELFSGGLVDKILYCTGLQIMEDDDLPKHICKLCFHSLNNANKFKTTCLLVDEALHLIYKSNDLESNSSPASENNFNTTNVKNGASKKKLSPLSKKGAKFSNKVVPGLNCNNDSICDNDNSINDNSDQIYYYYFVNPNGDPISIDDDSDPICKNDMNSNGDLISNTVDLLNNNDDTIYIYSDSICDDNKVIDNYIDPICSNDINSNGALICNTDSSTCYIDNNGEPICNTNNDNSICYNDNIIGDSIYYIDGSDLSYYDVLIDGGTDVWSNSPVAYESDFEWPSHQAKHDDVKSPNNDDQNHDDHNSFLSDGKLQRLTITEDSQHRNPGSDEKYPHICEICGKMYGTRQYYINHYRDSHQPRRFKCDRCDYTAIKKALLKQHQRVHTGAKPYLCEHCPTSFSFKGALNYHVLSKHEKKHDFKCTMCEKAFCALSTLKQHLKEHSLVKPYQCQYCLVWISSRQGWRRHLNKRHGVIIPLEKRGRKPDMVQII